MQLMLAPQQVWLTLQLSFSGKHAMIAAFLGYDSVCEGKVKRAPKIRVHGDTALWLHCWQALRLVVCCISGTWGRQVVVIPHSAYKLLLQVPVQVGQDE